MTNPILKLWAPRLRHMAVSSTAADSSGKSCQTPAMALVENGSLSVVLNYGEQSDWVRNVMTAGSALVVNQGKRYTVSTSPPWGPGCEPSQNAGSALWLVPRNSDATGSIAGGGVAPSSWWVKAGVGEVERISDTV